MKTIQLRYFTGTGNSLSVLNIFSQVFTEQGHRVEVHPITHGMFEELDCDLLGIFCPTYSYAMPRIVRNYIKRLKTTKPTDAFMIATMGGHDEEGWTAIEGCKLLQKQGLTVVWSDAILMPNNWLPGTYVPSMAEALPIIAAGHRRARDVATAIIAGETYHKPFVYPPFGYLSRFAFHDLGIHMLWRMFKVTDECNSCGTCAHVCPTNSIEMVQGRPHWSRSCEQCLRCLHCCPKGAIQQLEKIGHGSRRNRYLAPDFTP